MPTIYFNDLKREYTEKDGWFEKAIATPIGMISQEANHGMYLFDTKIERPKRFLNLESIFIHVEDEFDYYFDVHAKIEIKKFIEEYE